MKKYLHLCGFCLYSQSNRNPSGRVTFSTKYITILFFKRLPVGVFQQSTQGHWGEKQINESPWFLKSFPVYLFCLRKYKKWDSVLKSTMWPVWSYLFLLDDSLQRQTLDSQNYDFVIFLFLQPVFTWETMRILVLQWKCKGQIMTILAEIIDGWVLFQWCINSI